MGLDLSEIGSSDLDEELRETVGARHYESALMRELQWRENEMSRRARAQKLLHAQVA